ncbi:MAG: hypothetical protein E6K18_06455 [Methanobacteriota archaeon]|nr:MAG: hypothetical protein E6K18_06455 [Euryarchaeota archaeon]
MVFDAPRHVAAIMRGFDRPWFVAGGWAIDLFLGKETRAHEDIEVAIFRRDQDAIWRHFSGWEMEKIVSGGGDSKRQVWRGEWLSPPIHEIHAKRSGGELRDLEILFDEAWADTWRFRRELAVSRPVAEIGSRTADGVPFLAPDIVLLYKAKASRPDDEADFRATFPVLPADHRRWLMDAIERVHPGHPWIASLRSPPTSRQSS